MILFSYIISLSYLVIPSVYFIINNNPYYTYFFIATSLLIFYFSFALAFLTFLLIFNLNKSKSSKIFYKIIKSVSNFILKYIFFCNIIKVNDFPIIDDNKNYILVCNHKSKIDPLFLLALIKNPIGFTPKSDLYKYNILKMILNKLNSIVIYRNDIRKTIKELQKGKDDILNNHTRYLIFTEGGTQNKKYEYLYNSKPAAYKIIKETNSSVIPIRIINNLNFKYFGFNTILVKFLPIIKHEEFKDLSDFQIKDLVEKSYL